VKRSAKIKNQTKIKMNTEAILSHVKNASAEARADMAAGNWDEVMTDALYAACGASTAGEMAEARSKALAHLRAL